MPKNHTRQIVFVKSGKFSGANPYIESILERIFPGFEVCVIDVNKLLRAHPALLIMIAFTTFLRKPGMILGGNQSSLKNNILFHLWRSPITFKAISRLVRETILQNYSKAAFILQTQSMWDSTTAGIPVFIYTDSAALTNLYFSDFPMKDLAPLAWIRLEQQSYETARRIFVWSNHVSQSFQELYHQPTEKIVNIKVGCNLPVIPAAAVPAPAGNKAILFVGIDWHRKGGDDLVAAFKRLPERHSDAQLIIIGCTPEISVRNSTVLGRVPASEIASWYKKAAIFCLPTHVEPFGIAFIEAMAHSLATIAPEHGAMPDYIRHKSTGMLHKPGDVNGILECLTYLLDSPDERRAIAARGYEAVIPAYTWDMVGKRMHEEIGKVVPL